MGNHPLWKAKLMKETIEGNNIRKIFSKNLKRLRAIAKLSQVNLAVKADLSHNFINDIENGKKWASPDTIAKLASALKAEPYQFFLSDAKWQNHGTEMFALYLKDFYDSFEKMVNEYRGRFLKEE
jgi:transcriptional regulator with XRE-family HTH domain